MAECGNQYFSYKKLSHNTLLELIKDLQYNLDLKEIDLAKKYDVSLDTISKINMGVRCKMQGYDYPLRKHYKTCAICGKRIDSHAKLCVECFHKQSRLVERPSKEQLLEEIATSSFLAVGNKYGVSDNAIRKWCIAYGLPTKKKEIKEYYSLKKEQNNITNGE